MERTAQVLTYRTADGNVLPIECHTVLASTAALAREYARRGYPDRYCVFSEAQTDTTLTGVRLSERHADHGVFVSCILRPRFFPAQTGALGALCAVALASALEEHTDRSMDIGWISDVFCEGKRIGGCAMESRLDSFTAYEYLIVTFAVHVDEHIFPRRLSDMMKQVFATNLPSLAMRLCESILDRFFKLYRDLQNPQKYMDDYRRRFIMTGMRAVYTDGERRRRVRILGIDPDECRLVIDLGRGGIKKISGKACLSFSKRVPKFKRNDT